MREIRAIVVGTDGSRTADRAVDHAADLARALGATVHVVNCFGPSLRGGWMAASSGLAVSELVTEDEARESAKRTLDPACERLRQTGLDVRSHACSGDPADALMAIAEGEGAQLIVVGNRGMAGARRMLGSVPNRVSHHARCAVMIVPTHDGAPTERVDALGSGVAK